MGTSMPGAVDTDGGAFTTASPSSPRRAPSLAGNVDGLISASIATERIVVGPTWLNPCSDVYGALGNGSADDTNALRAWATAVGNGGFGVVPPNRNFKI